MRVVVTGSTGRLGRSVVDAARAAGHRVEPLARSEAHPCDLTDPAVVDQLLEGVDVLIHMAGTSVERPLPEIIQNNLVGLHAVYEGARRHGALPRRPPARPAVPLTIEVR